MEKKKAKRLLFYPETEVEHAEICAELEEQGFRKDIEYDCEYKHNCVIATYKSDYITWEDDGMLSEHTHCNLKELKMYRVAEKSEQSTIKVRLIIKHNGCDYTSKWFNLTKEDYLAEQKHLQDSLEGRGAYRTWKMKLDNGVMLFPKHIMTRCVAKFEIER